MLLLSGFMTLADIQNIRDNAFIFKRLTQCGAKEKHTGVEECKNNKDEVAWPDLKLVFRVLWRHYLATRMWCGHRYTPTVESNSEELVPNPKNSNWDEWKAIDHQHRSVRGPPFWAASESVKYDTTEVPDWGFSVDKLTENPVNIRIHATDSEQKYAKWSSFCQGFLLDKFGFEKNILSTESGAAAVQGAKALAKRAQGRLAGGEAGAEMRLAEDSVGQLDRLLTSNTAQSHSNLRPNLRSEHEKFNMVNENLAVMLDKLIGSSNT